MRGKKRGRSVISLLLIFSMLSLCFPHAVWAEEAAPEREQAVAEAASETGEEQEIAEAASETGAESETDSETAAESSAAETERERAETVQEGAAERESAEAAPEIGAEQESAEAAPRTEAEQETAENAEMKPEETGVTSAVASASELPVPEGEGGEMPALRKTLTAENGVTVKLYAEKGTFPRGSYAEVREASREEAMEAAQQVVQGTVVDAAAVDITFYNEDGEEIEPADQKRVHVSLKADRKLEGDEYRVVHIEDNGEAEIISEVSHISARQASFSAESFTIYSIIGEELPTRCYRFFKAEGSEEIWVKQRVKEGEELLRPRVPEHAAGREFLGWYEAGASVPFDGFGTVNGITESSTVDLYARYSSEVHIFYHSIDGTIIRVDSIEENHDTEIERKSPYVQMASVTQTHNGWYLEGDAEKKDISGHYHVGTEDLHLYPLVEDGWWIIFDTKGGSTVENQFVGANDTDKRVIEKQPLRTGYVFDGWYEDEGYTKPWDFTRETEGAVTLYAKWNPGTADYAVQYFRKDPNDETKDILIKQTNHSGTVGAEAGYEWDAATQKLPELTDEEYFGLHIDQPRTDAAREFIKPDGSTVRKVYLESNVHSITMKWTGDDGIAHEATTEVRYKQNLRAVWDKVKPYDVFIEGTRWQWANSGGATWANSYLDFPVMVYDEDILWVRQTGILWNLFYQIFYEGIDGEVPEGCTPVENGGRIFYLKKESGFRAGWNGALDPPLAKDFAVDLELSEGNISTWKLKNCWLVYFHKRSGENWKKHWMSKRYTYENQYEFNEDPDHKMQVYMRRLRYALRFHENGGAEIADIENIPYEKKLGQYEPLTAYPIGVHRVIDGQELQFAGWYTDSDCKGLRFDFAGSTMPADNLDLYAKWEPLRYTVYFDSDGGTPVAPAENIRYGMPVTKPKDPTCDGYSFIGWMLDGKPYSFESGVSQDLTLKAQWRSLGGFRVRYDLNGGSGRAPEDLNGYYENTEAEAKAPSEAVAPEGKVFIGWRRTDTGERVYPGGILTVPGDVTLSAEWGDIDKTTRLLYDFNFGSYGIRAQGPGSNEVREIENNSIVKLRGFSYMGDVPDGYEFAGWYATPDASGEALNQVQIDRINEDKNRVYAAWKRVKGSGGNGGGGGNGGSTPASPVRPAPATPPAPENVVPAVLGAARDVVQHAQDAPGRVLGVMRRAIATGDQGMAGAYAAVFLAAFSGMAVWAVRRRKREKRR